MKKVLIDASTIRAGGGIQVSLSFLNDLIKLKKSNLFDLYLSKELFEACKREKIKIYKNFNLVRLRNLPYLFSIFYQILWYQKYDKVFNIFGPPYFLFKPKKIISGFARTQFFFPNIYWKSPKYNSLVQIIKKFIQIYFFKRVDEIVTESKSVSLKFKRILKTKKKMHVVYNCLSKDFLNGTQKIKFLKKNNNQKLKLLYVGANYPHKNLEILGRIHHQFYKKTNQKILYLLTLSIEDFNKLPSIIKNNSHNFGIISQKKLKNLYKEANAVIFPSLAESFSISPIEALYCGKPLIASNRAFVREFCKNIPFYFDPHNEKDLLSKLLHFYSLKKNSKYKKRLKVGKKISLKYRNSLVRTKLYLRIIFA